MSLDDTDGVRLMVGDLLTLNEMLTDSDSVADVSSVCVRVGPDPDRDGETETLIDGLGVILREIEELDDSVVDRVWESSGDRVTEMEDVVDTVRDAEGSMVSVPVMLVVRVGSDDTVTDLELESSPVTDVVNDDDIVSVDEMDTSLVTLLEMDDEYDGERDVVSDTDIVGLAVRVILTDCDIEGVVDVDGDMLDEILGLRV